MAEFKKALDGNTFRQHDRGDQKLGESVNVDGSPRCS